MKVATFPFHLFLLMLTLIYFISTHHDVIMQKGRDKSVEDDEIKICKIMSFEKRKKKKKERKIVLLINDSWSGLMKLSNYLENPESPEKRKGKNDLEERKRGKKMGLMMMKLKTLGI